MLHRSSTSVHPKKTFDAIQKHKIRNLRAKLKNLLSSDSCTKYSKRQNLIKKIQSLQNQQFYLNRTLLNQQKHLFTHTKQNPKQFWYSQKQKCNVMNVFGKLSKDQIQQIQQDMIYYLGQENVAKFKQFLLIKESLRQKNQHNKENQQKLTNRLRKKRENSYFESNQHEFQDDQNNQSQQKLRRPSTTASKNPGGMLKKNTSITDNNFLCRKSVETLNQQNILQQSDPDRRLKTANVNESRASLMSKRQIEHHQQQQRQKFQANYLGNRENFLNKRRMLQEQENAQRLLSKVSLELKQQKAVDIFRNTQVAFVASIKQKNQQNDFRTKKILQQKYKKNVTFGEIVELNQQLRKIYIKKISEIPKFGQVPESQVINERHNANLLNRSLQSGFFFNKENNGSGIGSGNNLRVTNGNNRGF